MEQLKEQFYTKEELAEITGARLEDTKHFKRNIENALSNWGYGCEWIHGKGIYITHVPTTAEERLQEVLIRQFHVDLQVDMYAFACFVTAFTDVDGFISMPWAERVTKYMYYAERFVCTRTLRNWCHTLLKHGIMATGGSGSYWKTEIDDDRKIRTLVTKEEAQEYFERRSELIDEYTLDNVKEGMTYQEARREAWGMTYSTLWREFNCCYYYCKSFYFTVMNEQGPLAEVYELTREISGKEENRG